MKLKNLFFLSVMILLSSCKSEPLDLDTECALEAQINEELLNGGSSDDYTLENVHLDGDCMTIVFSAGGCSGDFWNCNLVGSSMLQESDPPQRTIRLLLNNTELCEAWITRDISFDISDFKEGTAVVLNLVGYDEGILYE